MAAGDHAPGAADLGATEEVAAGDHAPEEAPATPDAAQGAAGQRQVEEGKRRREGPAASWPWAQRRRREREQQQQREEEKEAPVASQPWRRLEEGEAS